MTPTPTPTVTPTPAPAPGPSGSLGIMTPSYVGALRGKVSGDIQPWASAWARFQSQARAGLVTTPNVFAGPDLDASGSWGTLQQMLDRDGAATRSLSIGYAVTGDVKYAAKAREFLLAWATSNHPTTKNYDSDPSGGSYASHGYFCFAYAYDLTQASGVYSAADKAAITAYFKTASDSLATYLDWCEANVWDLTQTTRLVPYEWKVNPLNLSQNVYDQFVGSDLVALTTAARLALSIEAGDIVTVHKILDPGYVFSVQSIVDHACAGRNDGDGVPGHPVPVPANNIFKPGALDNPGRGGCVDYMTYNTRMDTILLLMAQAQGADVAKQVAEVKVSWDYLQRFFGANAEPSPAPNDAIDLPVNLSRFVIVYHLFPGEQRLLDVLKSGDLASYDENQFLGPTTLTMWPLGS